MQETRQRAEEYLMMISSCNGHGKTPQVKKVDVYRDNNMTAAIINGKYFGWAKYNPFDDKYCSQTGVRLALYRACQKMYSSANS